MERSISRMKTKNEKLQKLKEKMFNREYHASNKDAIEIVFNYEEWEFVFSAFIATTWIKTVMEKEKLKKLEQKLYSQYFYAKDKNAIKIVFNAEEYDFLSFAIYAVQSWEARMGIYERNKEKE